MIIDITNQQQKIPLPAKKIIAITKRILKTQGIHRAGLSLVFVTDPKIKNLSKKYLHHDYATDVLAFDLSDLPPKKSRQPKTLNGEIVISTATVYRNSRSFGTTPWEELVLCVIHGILHLTGFDDHKPAALARMREREGQILTNIFKS